MSHLEPDRLTLLALGSEPGDPGESGHLADCAGCRAQLDDLRAVAELGAETQQVRDLPPAPEWIWRSVEAATGPAVPRVPAAARPAAPTRPRTAVLVAAVVVVLAVAGVAGLAVIYTGRPASPATPVAQAQLDRLAGAPAGARGTARIDDASVRLHVTGMPLQPGYYEVWLLDPDTNGMISLGAMGTGADATFPLPPGVNLREYRMVDVSAEPYDGNPAHSDRSMLRGAFTR